MPAGAVAAATSERRVPAAVLGCAGGVAGAVAKTAVAPLERIKLLNQVGHEGALETLRRVTFHEGFWALWRGNSVNVLRMIPNKGVLLACSDLYKEPLRALERNKFWHGAASGALAGATAALLTYPLDLARSRMAGLLKQRGDYNRYHRAGLSGTLAIIRREEGLRGLFAGLSPTLAGAFPYEGLKFGTYDALKHSGLAGEGGGGSLWKATCGALAATAAHLATYPNDTVRRRMQVQGADGQPPKYTSALDCYFKVKAAEGWTGLYRGLGITLIRGIPNTGIQFLVYETLKDVLDAYG